MSQPQTFLVGMFMIFQMSGKENEVYIPGRSSKVALHSCVNSEKDATLIPRRSLNQSIEKATVRSRSSSRAGEFLFYQNKQKQ